MSRIVILKKWVPILPIYVMGVRLELLRSERNNVICLPVQYTGLIPTSAHVMKAMKDKKEMAAGVCNVCMKEGVAWVCVNSEHVPVEPLGFHLCDSCYIRIQDKFDTALRIPLAEVVGNPKGKFDPDNTLNASTAVTVSI
jgi:hypothetical protein